MFKMDKRMLMNGQFRKYINEVSDKLKNWDNAVAIPYTFKVSAIYVPTPKDYLRKRLVELYKEVGK